MQAKFESYLSQGQAGIYVFLEPCYLTDETVEREGVECEETAYEKSPHVENAHEQQRGLQHTLVFLAHRHFKLLLTEKVRQVLLVFKSQGSRLTFKLASPVASDRFYSLAKTKFSLARYSNIHHRIK